MNKRIRKKHGPIYNKKGYSIRQMGRGWYRVYPPEGSPFSDCICGERRTRSEQKKILKAEMKFHKWLRR